MNEFFEKAELSDKETECQEALNLLQDKKVTIFFLSQVEKIRESKINLRSTPPYKFKDEQEIEVFLQRRFGGSTFLKILSDSLEDKNLTKEQLTTKIDSKDPSSDPMYGLIMHIYGNLQSSFFTPLDSHNYERIIELHKEEGDWDDRQMNLKKLRKNISRI